MSGSNSNLFGGLSGLFAMGGGGTGTGFNPNDPNALAHALQMHAALGMLQQGSDSSPTRSPMQGIDRGANAILGALMMRNMMHPGAQPAQAGSSNPNLVWNPNNPVGTESLGGMTANQGSGIGNWAATNLPGLFGGG